MKNTFTLEIADTIPCLNCRNEVAVGDHVCESCGTSNTSVVFSEFFAGIESGKVLNAKNGGLIIGREGPIDDIPMYMFVDNGIFQCVGYMQGGEYLLSAAATEMHMGRLKELNAETGESFPLVMVPVTDKTSIINVNGHAPTAALWIANGQFAVNRFATARHLEELELMNAAYAAESMVSEAPPQ